MAVPVAIPGDTGEPSIDTPPNPLSLGVFEPGGVVVGKDISEGQIFVSNLFFGGIRVVDTINGEIRVLVANDLFLERLAYGMEYYEPTNALFVSGSEKIGEFYVGEIRVYDVASGMLLSNCKDDTSFPTDVAFVNGAAYVTNSAENSILKLDIESALSGACTFEKIQLPANFVPCDEQVNPEFLQGTIDKRTKHRVCSHIMCHDCQALLDTRTVSYSLRPMTARVVFSL